ncbi:MAG: SRPBCC family protein [Burkholderiaceae bacterium]
MALVFTSSIIDAPVPAVWAIIRDFNALPAWHPLITESRIEHRKQADQVGCVRNFRAKDLGQIREQLLSLSDYDFSFSYAILESPMPLTDYVATVRLHPVTDGNRTFGEWSARFECAPDEEATLVSNIGRDVFQAGFDSLKSRFR